MTAVRRIGRQRNLSDRTHSQLHGEEDYASLSSRRTERRSRRIVCRTMFSWNENRTNRLLVRSNVVRCRQPQSNADKRTTNLSEVASTKGNWRVGGLISSGRTATIPKRGELFLGHKDEIPIADHGPLHLFSVIRRNTTSRMKQAKRTVKMKKEIMSM